MKKICRAIIVSAALAVGAAAGTAAPAAAAPPLPAGGFGGTVFADGLADRLAGEGFDRRTVEGLLADDRAEILSITLGYAIVYRETKADYSHFLDADRLARARKFMARKGPELAAAEKRFGVPAEVTAAIIMIESDFGNFRRLHRLFNVFTTLVWAGEPGNFDAVRAVITKRLGDVPDEKIRARSRKKAAWGYQQLVTLLRITEREALDPFSVEGSWAGAFGLAQFIPTSYWDYAVDGDGDGRVDLFNDDDAVYSIGNYLHRFGWREGIGLEKKRAVIRRYNNSGLYVDTVLAAAERLGGD